MHYDKINIIGALPDGLSAEDAKYDKNAHNTVVNIKGIPSKAGADQRFSVHFQEGISKLDITVPMLINVNTYNLEYKVIGDSPAGFTTPDRVTGLGHDDVVTLNEAPKKVVAQKNGENGVWEFIGWSTDKDNIDSSIATSVKMTKDTVVYGKWKFTPMNKLYVTKKWEGKKQDEAHFIVEKTVNGRASIINRKDGNGNYIPHKVVNGKTEVIEVENENDASYRIIETDSTGKMVKNNEITINGTKYAVSYKAENGSKFEMLNKEVVDQGGAIPGKQTPDKKVPDKKASNKHTSKKQLPKTGDDSAIWQYMLFLGSASAIICCIVRRRKID